MAGSGTQRPGAVDRRLARLFVAVVSISLTVGALAVLVAHRYGGAVIERLRRR